MLELQAREGAVIFPVRLRPGASQDEIAGVTGGALRVRVRAPALEGRANDALCEYLAELLKTPKAAVRILSGQHSRSKRVEVRGVTELQVLALVTREAQAGKRGLGG